MRNSLGAVFCQKDVLCDIVSCAFDSIGAALRVDLPLAPPLASSLGVAGYPVFGSVGAWRAYAESGVRMSSTACVCAPWRVCACRGVRACAQNGEGCVSWRACVQRRVHVRLACMCAPGAYGVMRMWLTVAVSSIPVVPPQSTKCSPSSHNHKPQSQLALSLSGVSA